MSATDVNALLAGVLAAVFGAAFYGSIVLRREWRRGVGVAALGTNLLIELTTADNRSPEWHAIRFWVGCVLVAVAVVSFLMDSRIRRGSHSRTLGGQR